MFDKLFVSFCFPAFALALGLMFVWLFARIRVLTSKDKPSEDLTHNLDDLLPSVHDIIRYNENAAAASFWAGSGTYIDHAGNKRDINDTSPLIAYRKDTP